MKNLTQIELAILAASSTFPTELTSSNRIVCSGGELQHPYIKTFLPALENSGLILRRTNTQGKTMLLTTDKGRTQLAEQSAIRWPSEGPSRLEAPSQEQLETWLQGCWCPLPPQFIENS